MRCTPLVLAAALVVAACGGGETSTDTAATDPTETATTETATTDPPDTEPSTTAPPVTDPTTTTTPPTQPPLTAATGDVDCVAVSIETGAVTIDGERCDPAELPDAPFPATLVLNGCGGYEADSDVTAATVRALAERGVVGMRVDWLGAEPAPPDTYCAAGPVIGAVNPLLQGLVDAIASLRAEPTVDPDRVGTAAYSLGAIAVMAAEFGGAGLTEVTPLDLRAAALLSYPNQLPMIASLATQRGTPPLFLMTGSEDTTAPPLDSQTLATAAREGGSTADVVIVEGQDHPWRGDAAVQAGEALAEFLATTLTAA